MTESCKTYWKSKQNLFVSQPASSCFFSSTFAYRPTCFLLHNENYLFIYIMLQYAHYKQPKQTADTP